MPLTLVDIGVPTTIKAIRGKDQTRRFLQNLGFVEGGVGFGRFLACGQSDCFGQGHARCDLAADGLAHYGVKGEEAMGNLRNTPCGKTVTVRRVEGEGATRRRIMDMGITRGAEVFVRKVAPLGDPIEVTVRGYELSLRKADAEKILVE